MFVRLSIWDALLGEKKKTTQPSNIHQYRNNLGRIIKKPKVNFELKIP